MLLSEVSFYIRAYNIHIKSSLFALIGMRTVNIYAQHSFTQSLTAQTKCLEKKWGLSTWDLIVIGRMWKGKINVIRRLFDGCLPKIARFPSINGKNYSQTNATKKATTTTKIQTFRLIYTNLERLLGLCMCMRECVYICVYYLFFFSFHFIYPSSDLYEC